GCGEREPGVGKEPALGGIDQLGVAGRDVKKQRVEFIAAGNEAAPFVVVASASAAIGAVVFPPVPALGRDFHDAVLARAQVLPENLEIDRLGIAAAQPDNRNRIVFRGSAAGGGSRAIVSF